MRGQEDPGSKNRVAALPRSRLARGSHPSPEQGLGMAAEEEEGLEGVGPSFPPHGSLVHLKCCELGPAAATALPPWVGPSTRTALLESSLSICIKSLKNVPLIKMSILLPIPHFLHYCYL